MKSGFQCVGRDFAVSETARTRRGGKDALLGDEMRGRPLVPEAPPLLLTGSVFTLAQLRRALRVRIARIRKAVKMRQLRCIRFGTRHLFRGEAVADWLRGLEEEQHEE